MPHFEESSVESSPTPRPWLPAKVLGPKVKPTGSDLVHVYTTDTKVLDEADWVYLQVVLGAQHIHPATIDDLDALGPLDGENAKRWTIEGPLMSRPGDPGNGNCTLSVELAHSMSTDPGSNWIRYKPGARVRCRSAKARVTITRPTADYDFRIARLGLKATRVATAQRPQRVHAGIQDAIPAGMCRVIVRDLAIDAGADLVVDGDLEVLS